MVDGTEKDLNKEVKAKSKLILLIDSVNYVHVQSAKMAAEVWQKLKYAFEDTGLTRKVGLLETLITIKLSDNGSVDEYVNKIVLTAHKLRSIGMDISDEWIGTLLLAGLPEMYGPMIM